MLAICVCAVRGMDRIQVHAKQADSMLGALASQNATITQGGFHETIEKSYESLLGKDYEQKLKKAAVYTFKNDSRRRTQRSKSPPRSNVRGVRARRITATPKPARRNYVPKKLHLRVLEYMRWCNEQS